MAGGLLNLIAYGNQNIIVHGNPSKTFFKAVYAKHTNFGIQKFRLDYDGSSDIDLNSETVYKFKVERRAELLLDSYLVMNLPDIYSTILPPTDSGDLWKPYHFKWIKNIGTNMIKHVRILIGANVIQEYPGSYIQCVVERDSSASKRKMFDAMTGNIDELNMPEFYDKRLNAYPNVFFRPNSIIQSEPSIRGRKIYVPLNPWFMNDTKVSFPLTCLQYNEMVIEVTLRPVRELFTINDVDGVEIAGDYNMNRQKLRYRIQPNFTNELHSMYRFLQPPPTIVLDEQDYSNTETTWNTDIHLICNYCFLTSEETNIFCKHEQKILFKDVKHTVYHNLFDTKRVKVDSNSLVSSWMWFYRRSDANKNNSWSNHTNWPDENLPYQLESADESTSYISINSKNYGPAIDPGNGTLDKYTGHQITPQFSDQYMKEILQSFSIILDGKYRETEMDAGVYNYIEQYRCSNGYNDKGLYTYNFCINTDPRTYQPSGSINLNKFKNIELEMTLLSPNVDDERNESLVICDENGDIIGVSKSEEIYEYTYEMHLFEERYNILRVMSGNAGLLFAR